EGKEIARVEEKPDEFGRSLLEVELSAEGAAPFETFTRLHVGKQAAIVDNGSTVISAPVIQSVISGGRLQIYGMTAKDLLPATKP
ncbi:MAG TPA: hypothetical protein PKO06_08015, partial [Candidatus Ozemobacteraceae bacterium]|nr:hypothetical protein [Candidatus Ozemobacteraceae bacterium]